MNRVLTSIRRFSSHSVLLGLLISMVPVAFAQNTTGKVDITVIDPQGAVVEGARLELTDTATNDTRAATTAGSGTHSFVNLNIGTYKLRVTKQGFQTQEYSPVDVSAARTTSLSIQLKVGQATETVTVEATGALVDTTQNTIATTIDLKAIEDLPLAGRNLTQLARLTPGYTGNANGRDGTWNGLPSSSQGNNVDGVIGSPSRMKFGGNAQASIEPRLENIQEMTVQTDALDMNQGFGEAAMQINFVTRRGTNNFHGRLFEDFRNAALNANSWTSNASGLKKPPLILNEFGGSVGGAIIKDKLFFFGSLSNSRRPGGYPATADFLTEGAQGGDYTYVGTDGQTHTVNLFQVAQAYNPSLPGSVSPTIGNQLSQINTAVSGGAITPIDPIINEASFNVSAPTTIWYPTFRIDYNTTQALRMNFAFNRTKNTQKGINPPFFPGSAFANTGAGNQFDAYTASYGIDWMLSPRLVNQFKAGFLYNVNRFAFDTSRAYQQDPNTVDWTGGGSLPVAFPQNWTVPVTSYYPLINASDTVTWQRSAHTLAFGFSLYREQDHYWNPPELRHFFLGLVNPDPALAALTNTPTYNPLPSASTAQQAEAQQLYAVLAGRISGISGSYPYDPASGNYIQQPALAYNLDELSKAWGLFMQDSWRVRPSLTINYGLRWDFTDANHDLTKAYHNADEASLFGPSGINNVFNPGSLNGTMNPVIAARPRPYQDWNVSPQPAFGFAWNPDFSSGVLGKLTGRNATVIRGGFSLRKFTVPYQYFWDNASDYGSFFYQFYSMTPNINFTPGTLSLDNIDSSTLVCPPAGSLICEPTSYLQVAPEALYTFIGGPGVNGMKFKIRQPYTESWNFGIQRSFGRGSVLEVRYNGNRTLHQWVNQNLNEVNIFGNGFLQEFQAAQQNLQINGGSSFADLGGGTTALPIITGAFTGSTTGSQTNPEFSDPFFINLLTTGQAGSFANTLSGIGALPYFCNLVGASFTPCAANLGFTGTGAGFPINIFQANPFAAGASVGYMTDAGYSNYNALQVDFRQRAWHGITMDANYTWSHTLGVSTPNDWTGAYPGFTLRNQRLSYGPSLFDLRHVVHINTTVDLPFGRGRAFLNKTGVLDKVVGGWNVGTILTYQTGYPFRVVGGYATFNANDVGGVNDGGVVLNGVTRQQLQDSVGVYRVPGTSFVTIINPKYLATPSGGANPSFITPNTTPGTIAPPIYLYGPHGFFDDIAITKEIPFTERWRFKFQAEFLNAFNHPVFGQASNPLPTWRNILSTSWGRGSWNDPRSGTIPGFNRQIEFRANIEF